MLASAQSAGVMIETTNQEDIKQIRLELNRLKEMVTQMEQSLHTAKNQIAKLSAVFLQKQKPQQPIAEEKASPETVQARHTPSTPTPAPVTEQDEQQQNQEQDDDTWRALVDPRPERIRDRETEVIVRNVPYHETETPESLEDLIHLIAAHDH